MATRSRRRDACRRGEPREKGERVMMVRGSEASSNLVRRGGLAAALGVLWTASALITASKPRGCIGDECEFRTMREGGALDSILFLLALLLFALGTAALVARLRSAGRLGRLGRAGLIFIALGAALGATGMVLNVWISSLVSAFIIPGLLAVIVGFVLLAVAVLGGGVLPRWAAGCCRAGRRCCSSWALWRCSGSTTRTGRR